MKMKIYKEEKALAGLIRKNTTLSFVAQTEVPTEDEIKLITRGNNLGLAEKYAEAGIKDEDLFYHKSILVTTSWNKNDDLFVPAEVWAARHSPVHKPTNLNHKSGQVVGHITGNWAIDAEGGLLDDELSIDELPSKFHILVGSVIYKKFHNDPEKQAEAFKLIDEIGEGRQFVSMECSLRGFDYAIKAEDESIQIVARNEETAFLTKHLRVYGGAGIYEGYKVGRVLKNISFIGKAYTEKPANSESIIFTEADLFDFANASYIEKNPFNKKNSVVSGSNDSETVLNTSYRNTKDLSMSEQLLQDQNKELKAKNDSFAAEIEDLKKKLAEADVKKYETRVAELEASVKTLEDSKSAMDEEKKKKEKEMEGYKSKADELTEANEKLQKELDEVRAERVLAQRISSLVDGGLDKTKAETKAKAFANLNDEQFKAVADELIEAIKIANSKNTEDKNDNSSAKDADLDSSEAEDKVDLAKENSKASDETETARAAYVKRMATMFAGSAADTDN